MATAINFVKPGIQKLADRTVEEFRKVLYKYDSELPSPVNLTGQIAYLRNNEINPETSEIIREAGHLYYAKNADSIGWEDLGKIINDPPELSYFVGTREEWEANPAEEEELVYLTDENKLYFWDTVNLIKLSGDSPVFIGTETEYNSITDADLLTQIKLVYLTDQKLLYARIKQEDDSYLLEPITDDNPHFIGALSEWNDLTNEEKSKYRIVLITDNDIEDPDKSYRIPVGVIQAYIGAEAPHHWLICDGREFDETYFTQLYELLGDNHTPDLRGTYLTQAGTVAEGTSQEEEYELGTVKSEQLPNVTGTTDHIVSGAGSNRSSPVVNGVFSVSTLSPGLGLNEGSWSGRCLRGGINIDLSRANSIYTNGGKVRPKSFVVNYIIRAE